MRDRLCSWMFVISSVFAGGIVVGCTASEPHPQAPTTTAAPADVERVSTTDEPTAPVSECTMSTGPVNGTNGTSCDDVASHKPTPALDRKGKQAKPESAPQSPP